MLLMNKDEVARSYFASGLWKHINDYYASLYGVIYRPNVTYDLPNKDYISEHIREIRSEIQMLGDVCEYSDELKEVAKQYLPLFLQEYPEYRDEKCLRIE